MKKIEFVEVEAQFSSFRFVGRGHVYEFPQIRETVKARMEAGWDFCGYVPLLIRSDGGFATISLIFQKEEQSE